MAQDYYRCRIALNPAVEDEQRCIEYLKQFGDQRVNELRDLLIIGVDVKTGVLVCSDDKTDQLKTLEDKIEGLKNTLKGTAKSLGEAKAELEKKEKKILELEQVIRELNPDTVENLNYEAVNARVLTPETATGKSLLSGEESRQTPEVIRYEVQEQALEGFSTLEEYAIKNKLEPGIMTMIACAIDNHVSYRTILSMVENGLNAHQMRGVIDLVLAKRQREINKRNDDKQHDK